MLPDGVDPFSEMHLLTVHATRGPNYWARRPVIRFDVSLGAYDDISSLEAPGFTEQLLAALPSLTDHHCSIGTAGGFVQRLHTGTYAAHIAEHVAIELQCLMGDLVGFGQTRETGVPGDYTVVFEHRHEAVGLRAAIFALEIVQHAFAGTLLSTAFGHDRVPMLARMLAELRALRTLPDTAPIDRSIQIGVTGGHGRAALCELLSHGDIDAGIVDVSPSYILHAGLPYAHSRAAVILDATPRDVSARYRDPERAARLVAVVADAVGTEDTPGAVICPADLPSVHDRVRMAGADVVTFTPSTDIAVHVHRAAESLRRWEQSQVFDSTTMRHADSTAVSSDGTSSDTQSSRGAP